ncbi:histidine kinase N-terminal 7TM domain-containing protein [Paenibacillus sp. HB172176]|uniref:sensor histidine kinase n=1 Tax=Paenibacillus sp. HB172176 TaxID=2493690 RepID=UPI0023F85C73|nr:histidine kinase N-terminal 7TM domain-containing protein [Paenibacillus sp. HB172176]
MLISVFLMSAFLCYSFFHRNNRGVRYFAWVMVCRVVYAGCVILESNTETLDAKLVLRNIGQTSLLFLVAFVVMFVLDLLQKDAYLRPIPRIMLLSLFGAWSALVWTDPFHHLIYADVFMKDGYLQTIKSVFAISFTLFWYLILAVCVFSLITYIRNIRPEIRKPAMWMLVFGCATAVVEIIKLIFPHEIDWLLPLSVYTGFLGMAMLWITIRFRLFSIVPLARNIVMETMQEGILVVSQGGAVIDSNNYAESLFEGVGIGRTEGRNIRDLLSRWPEWLRMCERMEQGEAEIQVLLDKETRVYAVKVYPVYARKPVKHGSVSVLIDITEKQRRLEQISELNKLKDQLFTVVSHDIRDPLAVQVNLIEELEESKEQLDSDMHEIVDALSEQARNTFVMIENLLDWFRSQKEGTVLHPQWWELSPIANEALGMLRMKSGTKRVKVHLSIPADIRIYADREAVTVIIRNLLSNAIKFSREGGSVLMSAEAKEETVTLSVQDNGIGMSTEQLQSLFDSKQIVTTVGTAGERGTGLGLQVCQYFVRMNGGRIWAESTPQLGSVFRVSLRGSCHGGEGA